MFVVDVRRLSVYVSDTIQTLTTPEQQVTTGLTLQDLDDCLQSSKVLVLFLDQP